MVESFKAVEEQILKTFKSIKAKNHYFDKFVVIDERRCKFEATKKGDVKQFNNAYLMKRFFKTLAFLPFTFELVDIARP